MTAYSAPTMMRMRALESVMVAHGSDPSTATRQAYGAIWGMVQRQASMTAFVDTFRAMAVVFLLVLPLLFLMKKPVHHRR